MGILDSIRRDASNSGKSKAEIMYFKEGEKKRVRFLQEFDSGIEVKFHDSFKEKIFVPCLEFFGKTCKYCDDDRLRTRSQYVWSVYDYDSNKVKLLVAPVNNCSPIPALMSMYEDYGTILDRDYTIQVKGKGTEKTFTVVPQDKVKFKNTKVSPYSLSKIKSIFEKAYLSDMEDDEDDEDYNEDTKPKKKKKHYDEDEEEIEGMKFSSGKKKHHDEDEDEDAEEKDYEDMSAKELYQLCKERKLDVEKKMKPKYYITQLKKADKAEDDWEDDEDEEEDDE